MKTIIAPTDFSAVSYNACLYAAGMAEDINAELILLHVMELPVAMSGQPLVRPLLSEIIMEDELKRFRDKLRLAINKKVSIQAKSVTGSVEDEIIALSNQVKPFAVVMGTHGYNFIDNLLIGSRTLHTAKYLRFPVLIVPADATYKPVKKIALASDMTNIDKVPAYEIEMIVGSFNAELEIFHVGEGHKQVNDHLSAGQLLNNRLAYSNPQFYFTESENILQGVNALAYENNTDLLIIIPKKEGIFYKSQSKKIIFNARVPVIALHENDVTEIDMIYSFSITRPEHNVFLESLGIA